MEFTPLKAKTCTGSLHANARRIILQRACQRWPNPVAAFSIICFVALLIVACQAAYTNNNDVFYTYK